jgi:hypothetical protein
VFDVVATEVPRRVDVGDHAHLAAVVGQAFAKDGVAAVFENGGFDGAIHQDPVGRSPVGVVALGDAAPVNEQAVAAGQTRMLAG